MSFGLKSGTSIAALSIALSPAALAAQTTGGEASGARDDNVIIVTAQKREENIQDVPIAISAIGGEFLDDRDITSIDDLGSIAPNVKIERAPNNSTAAQVSIRGSVTINPAITWEPAVGIYLDGVYIAKGQGSIFDVADLERVEVLRGPQGTLYGRNTLAGAINLVTAKPSGEFGAKLEATYGSFDYRRLNGSVDLPALGPLSVKVSGQVARRDGFVDAVANPQPGAAFFAGSPSVSDVGNLKSESVMVQARFEPTDTITLDYVFDYSNYNQRPTNSQLLSINTSGALSDIFDPNSPSFVGVPLGLFANSERQDTLSLDGGPLFERSKTQGHALTATFDFGAAQLKSITSIRDMNWSDSLDLDGSPIDIAFTQRLSDLDSFSQELQLTGEAWDNRLRYVIGGFYYEEEAATLNPQRFFGVFGPFGNQFDSRYGAETEAWAVYAQADIDISDALTLTLGGRYTEEEKKISRFLQVLSDPMVPAAALPLTVANIGINDLPPAKFDNFSPSATLNYAVSDDVNVYARFAKGFKSGGFNGETNQFVAPTADCPTGTPELCVPYRPEKVDSYELGLKSTLAAGALVLNLAAFYNKHEDIQLSVFEATGAASSSVLNAARATIWGLEAESVIRPSDRLTINASFAYLNAEYDSFIERGVDVTDNRAFPHTPELSVNLGVDWTALEGDWGQFNLLGDLNVVSSYFTYPYALRGNTSAEQIATTTESQGRVMLNLTAILSEIEVGGTDLIISGWVRNVTGEDRASNFIDFGPGFGGLLLGYFPDPRTYGVSVGVEF